MVSDLIESHSPVFFPLVCASFSGKNVCKKLGGAFCSLLSNAPSKRNLLFSRTMKPAKRPVAGCFLHTFLLENEAQTSGKKYRAVTFYIIGDHMQKFSSFGRKKKKQTKIRHRMVMLEGLHLLSNIFPFQKYKLFGQVHLGD